MRKLIFIVFLTIILVATLSFNYIYSLDQENKNFGEQNEINGLSIKNEKENNNNIVYLQTGTSLTDNQAYIKNPTSQTITNQIVSFPIGFQQGQYTSSTISNVRLQGLTTQVQPTTYYSDGSVRTAIVYALVTLNPGQEVIYNIIESSTLQNFNPHASVDNFINNGEIKVITRDRNGNPYTVIVPLDSSTLEIDGPVIKKYHYEKSHDKPLGFSYPLDYLLTSVFEIEIVSGQPWIKIQHLVVNSQNLAEDVQTGLNYAEGQLGPIRYNNIEMYIDTNNPSESSDVYVSLLGGNTLQPTRIAPKPSPQENRIWIMPSDGQQTLFNNYNSNGQHENVNYNYLAPGQGFLTEVTLWLDSTDNPPKGYDPIYESLLSSGTSLARFNLIPDGIFPDIPNPRLLGQDTNGRFDFNTLAIEELNFFDSQKNSDGYRFGKMGTGKFDMGQTGESATNDEISKSFVYYLMSCNDRCDNRLYQTTRLFKYGAAYTGDIVVGFKPRQHLLSQLYAYRTPLFGTFSGGDCATKDFLGYCNVRTNNLAPSFVANSSEDSRGWTHQDDAHGGLGAGIGYYILTGDRMSHYITKMVYAPNIAHANYGYLYGSSFQVRAFGRLGHSITHLYHTETDQLDRNYLVTTGNRLFSIVGSRIDQSNPGDRGNHPVTGEDYAVGFLGESYGDVTCYNMAGQELVAECELRSSLWQNAITAGGLTNIYRTIPLTDPNFARSVIEKILETQFTYGYKDYNQIRTASSGQIPGTVIKEGTGYFANYLVIGPPAQGYCSPPSCGPNQIPYANSISTFYGDTFIDYTFPGFCLALKYVIDPINPNNEWTQKFEKAVKAGLLYVISNKDSTQEANQRGLSVQDTHFHQYLCPIHYKLGIPNAREVATISQIDNDNDGFSEVAGDCNDTNSDIYPAAGETWNNGCNDNRDNNCNGLVDCDDPQCTISIWPPNNEDCRPSAGTPRPHLGDGVVQNPNYEGRAEECDISIIGGLSTNSCAEGKCVASYVYAEGNNGLCALGILPPPNPPENLVVSGSTFSQVDLIWTDTSNNEQGFKIERSNSQTSGFSQIGTTIANDNTFSDTTAFQSTTYYYRVRSYIGGSNSVYSNVASVTTTSAPSCSSQGGDLCASNEYCPGNSLQHSGSGICCNIACQVGAPGLVVHYKFDDSPTDGADDSGPNNLDGTCTSGACPNYLVTGGQINGAYDFDGVNDRITVADHNLLDLTTQGSMMAWVRKDSSKWHGIIAKGNVPPHAYEIEITPGNRATCNLAGSQSNFVISTTVLANNVYYHIACTWNGATLRLYINGILEQTITNAQSVLVNNGNLHIGAWPPTSGTDWDWMDGSIDEVRIYDHALTQNEIQTVMGSQPSSFDYSISVSPNSGSVQQTNSVSATVTATHLSGTGASVSFSANNLPSGVTASFNPASCTPVSGTPCTSTMTLSASALAGIVNSHQVSVIGSSGSLVRNAAYSLTITQLPPNVPTGLAVTNPTSSSLVINWNDVNGETSYTLQRCTGTGCSNFANVPGAGSLPSGTTTFTDTGLTASTTYLYRIQASNSGGSSAFSSPVSGTTSPSAPNSPTISGITPTTSQWINGNLVTISGTNFASNAQVLINNVLIADSRLTKTSNTITFNRNAQEFNVGLNAVVVTNPTTGLSASNSFTLTANPSILSIVPNPILNNIINIISINGNQFDPLAIVTANGVSLNQFGIVTYVNPTLMTVILPTGFAGDFAVGVTSGDGLVSSAPLNLRMNYPFFYVLSTSASAVSVNSGETFDGFVKVETSPFVTPETINFAVSAPSGMTVTLNQNSCDFNFATTPNPSCEVDFSVSTTGLAPGTYDIVFTSNSLISSITYESPLTITINPSSPQPPSSGSGGGSGGSGGGSGGIRPKSIVYQCSDDLDNDGDGKIDYPQDLGCSSTKDNSELEPGELVEPTKTWTEEETKNLGSGNEDVEVRVLFITSLIILVTGIIIVAFLIVKSFNVYKDKSVA